jgi:hypothetical protein
VPFGEEESTINIDKYHVDIDFDVTIGKGNDFFVFTTISINKDEIKKMPCHLITLDSVSVFTIERKGKVTQEMRDMYIKESAIGIAFNNARGFIQNITSYSPLGSYTFPLFAINILFNQKYQNSIDMESIDADKKPVKPVKRKSIP